jgi:lysophospholipase L1-like esterase
VDKDLSPLKVYNFAIGGSTMREAAEAFAQNLVIPYKPRAVILYEGSNDIARGTSPGKILEQFRDFYGQVRKALPSTRFYVLGIVPSPGKRFEKWDTIQIANATLKEECERYPWLTFIDTTSDLIGKDQQPRMECFLTSNIHMNSEGYKVWASEVAPAVFKAEKATQQVD